MAGRVIYVVAGLAVALAVFVGGVVTGQANGLHPETRCPDPRPAEAAFYTEDSRWPPGTRCVYTSDNGRVIRRSEVIAPEGRVLRLLGLGALLVGAMLVLVTALIVRRVRGVLG